MRTTVHYPGSIVALSCPGHVQPRHVIPVPVLPHHPRGPPRHAYHSRCCHDPTALCYQSVPNAAVLALRRDG